MDDKKLDIVSDLIITSIVPKLYALEREDRINVLITMCITILKTNDLTPEELESCIVTLRDNFVGKAKNHWNDWFGVLP